MSEGRRRAPSHAGTARDGFDFTRHIRDLCTDLVTRLPDLAHIDMRQVAIGFSQTRKPGRHGIQASLTPMRFANGSLVEQRHGTWYMLQRLYDRDGVEMLYLLNFYLPRFMNEPFRDKLITVVHELWHIGPRFDGDIRRHGGRCYAHSGSQEKYDAHMARLAEKWMALDPPWSVSAFLNCDFNELRTTYGSVIGLKSMHPKLLPISNERAWLLQNAPARDRATDT